jgi:hypothetical protein
MALSGCASISELTPAIFQEAAFTNACQATATNNGLKKIVLIK